jgi:hypothetical protein
MIIEIKHEELHILTQFIKDIIMALTLDDKVEAIGTKLDALIANGVKVDFAPVSDLLTKLQTTADAILAQELPTPPAA